MELGGLDLQPARPIKTQKIVGIILKGLFITPRAPISRMSF